MSFLSKVFRYENESGDSVVFTFENGFAINKPTGIDTITVKVSQSTGIDQVGATIQSRSIQPRPVNITGKLVGQFQSENKEKLLSVIRPDLSGKLYADDLYLEVIPTATPSIQPKPEFASFSFSLLAAYPYWRSTAEKIVALSGLNYLFRLPFNMTQPYQFAEIMKTQFVNVPNRSQLPVPFTLVFTAKGNVKNPRITSVETGKFLVVNKTMEIGEKITVQTTHGRTHVFSTVDGDIRGALSLKSNLTRLEPGDNVLKPDADEDRDSLEAIVTYAEEIVGVSV